MARTLDVSLALSGGAARGAFHLGAIFALQQHGVKIVAVSGTSIGAVIAVGIGSGVSPLELLRIFKSKAFLKAIGFNYFQKGLFRINEKAPILKEIAPISKLEDMIIPTFVTCVDLLSGETLHFNHGNAIKLAVASSALIPLFRPITYENHILIDGGFMDNLPVAPLLDLGNPIVSVDLFPLHVKEKEHVFSPLKRALFLSFIASSQLQMRQSDLYITDVALSHYGLFTFRELDRCFKLGYDKTAAMILTFMVQKSIMNPYKSEGKE